MMSLCGILLILFYPFEQTVVPAAHIQVVDGAGRLGPNLFAKQEWFDVTVEESQHVDYSRSDENGYVTFPRRSVRAPLALRIVNTVWRIGTQGHHASIGSSAAITVYGQGEPHMLAWTAYGRNGGRWPDEMQLKPWQPEVSP